MKPYTKKQYKEDFSLLQEFKGEFTQAVKVLPLHIHYQKPDENPVVHPTQMYYVNMDQTPFKHPISKNSITGSIYTYIFIGTDINPNGIDSTGRIGRTWTISFETTADVRPYRCKRIREKSTLSKFYGYAESSSEILERFLVWFSTYPAELKAKMIKG